MARKYGMQVFGQTPTPPITAQWIRWILRQYTFNLMNRPPMNCLGLPWDIRFCARLATRGLLENRQPVIYSVCLRSEGPLTWHVPKHCWPFHTDVKWLHWRTTYGQRKLTIEGLQLGGIKSPTSHTGWEPICVTPSQSMAGTIFEGTMVGSNPGLWTLRRICQPLDSLSCTTAWGITCILTGRIKFSRY